MAVYQMKDAVERAGTLDTDALVKALETQDLMGVYGRMRFDPKTHQIIPSTDPKEAPSVRFSSGRTVSGWLCGPSLSRKARSSSRTGGRNNRSVRVEILVYGIVQSVSLMLMALGFSLVYGVSRLPNFAHGALYVFSGFVAWTVINLFHLPFLFALALAPLVAALLGVLIYQLVLRRVRGMELSEVIATYAIGLAILEGLRWVGFRGTSYSIPCFLDGVCFFWGMPIDYQRLVVVGLGIAVMVLLWVFTRYTRIGLALRGIAQDEQAAMMLGINSDLAGSIAMGLGSALAGISAVTLLPLGNIVVEEGYKVLIYAIAVCVVGGLGSWAGTVVASFVLGFSQYLTVAYGKPHYQMVVMLLAVVVTLIVRPSGFFGKQKQLEERV